MTVTLINEIPIGIRFKPDSGLPSGCFKEEELLEHMNVTLPKKSHVSSKQYSISYSSKTIAKIGKMEYDS